MGGADKSIGTGFHGGHMIVHVPEILGGAREKILDSVNIIFAMFLGANTLTQHAMATYFDEYEKVRPEMDVNFGKFQNWSNMFRKSVEEVGLGYYFGAPDLPLYHFLELPPHIHSEDFAYELVRQHGIAVTPGAPFGVDGGIRIAMMRDPMAPVPIATIIKTLIQEWK